MSYRYNDALECLDRLLTVDPNNYEGHYLRGRVMVELNRPDDAVASCERATFSCERCLRCNRCSAPGSWQTCGVDQSIHRVQQRQRPSLVATLLRSHDMDDAPSERRRHPRALSSCARVLHS